MSDKTAITYELTEAEAQIVARALILHNQHLVNEYEKIAMATDVSEFLVAAARDKYNETVTPISQLHVRLSETFPVLKQV